MTWKTIFVFISSTFNDMHAERDYLIKNVFPELAEWCEKRRIRLVDIDLRWGVTSEDSRNHHALKKCLENIDDTQRFFLCLIGQRRGWVPNDPVSMEIRRQKLISTGEDPGECYEISQATVDEYPEVNLRGRTPNLVRPEDGEIGIKCNSITEIEVEHALLEPMYRMINGKKVKPQDVPRSVFFERVDTFTDKLTPLQRKIYTNDDAPNPQEAAEETEELKKRIKTKCNITKYSCDWAITDTPELAEEKINGEKYIDGKKVGDDLRKGRLVNFRLNASDIIEHIPQAKKYSECYNSYKSKCNSDGSVAFKDAVILALQCCILDTFPERAVEFVSEQDRHLSDLEQQALFVQSVSEGYVPRSDIERLLNSYLSDEITDIDGITLFTKDEMKRALLLSADAGLGKTTLLANFVNNTKVNDTHKEYGLFRFCGASDLTTDAFTLWRSICEEAKISLPESLEELRKGIPQVLTNLQNAGCRYLIIDAVNQMVNGNDMLLWFPSVLPNGLKVILSIKTTDENRNFIDGLQERFTHRSIGRLSDITVKKSLIEQFLKRYLKAFDNEQIEKICGIQNSVTAKDHFSDNPLFLKVLLHELHYFGSFTQLPAEVENYGTTPYSAFTCLLHRLEHDEKTYESFLPIGSVSLLFGLLSQARNGLSENELFDCFKQKYPQEYDDMLLGSIRFNLRQVRPFIARRNGRHDFLYEEFRIAAESLYTTPLHNIISASTFNTRPAECLYHALKYGDSDYLRTLYTDLDFLNRYYRSAGALSLKLETQNILDGIIPSEIRVFIDTTSAILEDNPDSVAETFYKELSAAYSPQVAALCKANWISMKKQSMREELLETGVSIKPVSTVETDILCGGFASASVEAFFLVSSDTIRIVDMKTMGTVSTFNLNITDTVKKLFPSPSGDALTIVMKDNFIIYSLHRDRSGGVISSEIKLQRNCRSKKFSGTCVFAASGNIVYQTPDNQITQISLITFDETQYCDPSDDLLSGYFVADKPYVSFKTNNGYSLHGTTVTFSSQINDMVFYNDKFYVMLNEREIHTINPETNERNLINVSFVPQSALIFGDYLLIVDEHGTLYTWDEINGERCHNMLSIGTWDMNKQLFKLKDKSVFFFSQQRYIILEETNSAIQNIIRAKITDTNVETLLIDDKGNCVFNLSQNKKTTVNNPYAMSTYGLTAQKNFICDWNRYGELLHMGDGRIAEFISKQGNITQIPSPKAMCMVEGILWLDQPQLFTILYSDGQIRWINRNGQIVITSDSFESLSRNYLMCDCGDYICVVTRRRLVQLSIFHSKYEETAISIKNSKGKTVHEEHWHLPGHPQNVSCMTYDAVQNALYIFDNKADIIRLPLDGKFVKKIITAKHKIAAGSMGIAAVNSLLYVHYMNKLCVMDLNTGEIVKSLPIHRSVSSIESNKNDVVVIENNQLVYKAQLERSI